MEQQLIMIVVMLVLSAFFSAIEMAFVSAEPLQLTLKRNQHTRTARLLNIFYAKPDFFIGTTLIGNTLSLVIYGIYMAQLLDAPIRTWLFYYLGGMDEAWFEILFLVLQSFVTTALVIVVAEFTPKSIAFAMPNKVLDFLVHAMLIFFVSFYPFVWCVVQVNKFLMNTIFKIPYSQSAKIIGLSDLTHFIKEQEKTTEAQSNTSGTISEIDADIFQNAIEFKNLKVRDCMIPRTDIVSVDSNSSIEALQKMFIESGHTKIIVYERSIDHVIGYCHALKMFDKPDSIQSIVSPILIVPESMNVQEMMLKFFTAHKSIAIVIDEFGGTAGVITIEDIIEEIFGEIEDEHDASVSMFQKINDNEYEVSAKLHIHELNSDYHLQIPEGEYDTLGGYIMYACGDIPQINTRVDTERYEMQVKSMKGLRIENVRIRIKNPQEYH